MHVARPGGEPSVSPFVLIDLSPARIAAIEAFGAQPTGHDEPALPPPRPRGLIGPGDALRVTVWEADPAATTLIDRSSLDVTLRVESDGTIAIPFAGRMAAAGRRAPEIERQIVDRLAGRALAPQAAVLLADDQTDMVVLQGEIAHPGRLPLASGAARLLDVVAMGGGPRLPAHQTSVRVTRGGLSRTRRLSEIAGDPALDIEIGPGDRVLLAPSERRYYASGALNRPGEQPFADDSMSLARCLGKIAGLQDTRADPRGVFVFRRQPARLTERLQPGPPAAGADPTQVIYRLDLADAGSFFVSRGFMVEAEDIIYVSNAPSTDVAKFLQLIVGVSNVAGVPRDFGAY